MNKTQSVFQLLLILIICLSPGLVFAHQQTYSESETALLAKVGEYITRYEKQFANIVISEFPKSETLQIQDQKA